MKRLATSLLVFWLAGPAAIPVQEKWVIGQESTICIEGKTNINNFRCDIFEYLPHDTLVFYRDDQTRKPLSIRGGISININRFDCHQKYITQDLRKTLKADQKPCLDIDLLNIGYFDRTHPPRKVNGWVDIEIAGTKRRIDINYDVEAMNGNDLRLTGTKTLNFSDFGLVPPRKLAGLIRVEEQICVRFQLLLRPI